MRDECSNNDTRPPEQEGEPPKNDSRREKDVLVSNEDKSLHHHRHRHHRHHRGRGHHHHHNVPDRHDMDNLNITVVNSSFPVASAANASDFSDDVREMGHNATPKEGAPAHDSDIIRSRQQSPERESVNWCIIITFIIITFDFE